MHLCHPACISSVVNWLTCSRDALSLCAAAAAGAVVGAYHYEILPMSHGSTAAAIRGGHADWKLLIVQVNILPTGDSSDVHAKRSDCAPVTCCRGGLPALPMNPSMISSSLLAAALYTCIHSDAPLPR
jgi:hypothetical protein